MPSQRTGTGTFKAAVPTEATKWKQYKSSLAGEEMNKLKYICTMGAYAAMRVNIT